MISASSPEESNFEKYTLKFEHMRVAQITTQTCVKYTCEKMWKPLIGKGFTKIRAVLVDVISFCEHMFPVAGTEKQYFGSSGLVIRRHSGYGGSFGTSRARPAEAHPTSLSRLSPPKLVDCAAIVHTAIVHRV